MQIVTIFRMAKSETKRINQLARLPLVFMKLTAKTRKSNHKPSNDIAFALFEKLQQYF